MPPRGRPRKGLMRIDAAIDAMFPFGFTVKQVRKCVKELLKEYGGDDGWPFIEEYSYMELIAALLRDVEKESQEEVALNGNQIKHDQNLSKEKSNGEEKAAVSDERALDTLQDEISPAKKNREDTLQDEISPAKKNKEDPPTKVPTKRKKHFSCYGWIEDDDDEEEDGNNFITLPPSSMVLGPPKAHKCLHEVLPLIIRQ